MKLNCGRDSEKYRLWRTSWHMVFAWLPVRVETGECRWLETVWRRSEWLPGMGGSEDGCWLNKYKRNFYAALKASGEFKRR